ncbi:hypothetical protein FAOOIDEN_02502 [Mannheimia haemolytica]|uniref:Uncharacterized protein n=1 Tax=Mannheimia haemolytica TaxID=75985 RepID=A0A378MRG8_MANHA|nr:hypothetical protein J450_01910 [Mannheimia haemolytica D171]STY50085.1 Uncharacterised protein [Mannheimia haemolytica]STY58708.1 Uncharacterised protein [Mannheimia haemolytica]STY65288.1 Uncharacterised protein [Mannheimia haemolytica]
MKYAKIILFLTAFAVAADHLELRNDCDGKPCTIAQR